jgi:hypothetical protein
MSTSLYPVHVDASLDPKLSRGLWLVKWLLVIPHYIVLAFLWLTFVVLSVVAFFAILFTGRYPRSIFDFNVGVLRWSWRVSYYAYGALGTDRYPPFTLGEAPDYPARLHVDYPEHLSRGLVLVKWWLLAIPHYLVVAFFAGGGVYLANEAADSDQSPWAWGSGLIGLLVLVAGVVLLFTGRYPQSVFDLVLGMNRWVLRVAAYAALMTDDYPPFRLDQGGMDPGSPTVTLPPPGGDPPTPAPVVRTQRPWSGGRVVALVAGSLLFLVAGGLLAGGTTLAVVNQTMRDDDGFFMTDRQALAADGFALSSEVLHLRIEPGDVVPDTLLGDAKVRVASDTGSPLFVGVADAADAQAYLDGVEHTTFVDLEGPSWGSGTPVYRDTAGGPPASAPSDETFWVAQASGPGAQSVVWPLESGDWTVVVMNPDGSRTVAADVSAGAEVPGAGWIITGILVAGGVLMVLALVLVIGALRSHARTQQ